jgi:drug/metabolite transporter (DMT)-like permease
VRPPESQYRGAAAALESAAGPARQEAGVEASVQGNGIDLKILGLILFSVSCGVLGQAFFKTGMQGAKVELGPQVIGHFFKPAVAIGIVCYAVATTSWLVILSKIPLSLAYPMVSVSYLLVVLVGRYWFRETVTVSTWLGLMLICSGVVLIGMGNPSTPRAQSARVTPAASPLGD